VVGGRAGFYRVWPEEAIRLSAQMAWPSSPRPDIHMHRVRKREAEARDPVRTQGRGPPRTG